MIREAAIEFLDKSGRVVGRLRIVQSDNGPPSLRLLTPAEARENGEERVQLIEGRIYDFELLHAAPNVRVRAGGIIKPNTIRPEIGRIETGLETGLIELTIEASATGQIEGRGAIEVTSSKISYREDYRGMLGFIANECSQLLFDLRASGRMRVAAGTKSEISNLQRQFEFLSTELNSARFRTALGRIMAMPHQRLQSVTSRVKIERQCRIGKDFARQVGMTGSRRAVPADTPLARLMGNFGVTNPSLPAWIQQRQQIESVDTPENRFVKHMLITFEDFLTRLEAILRGRATPAHARLLQRVAQLRQILDEPLRHEFFKSVRKPNMLPLGSPVLQKKAGYREMLEAWLRFELSSQLIWHGGDDVYSAGKRDIASLYEYWLFFQLLRLFRDKFEAKNSGISSLFERSEAGLNLRLKTGDALGIDGFCVRKTRRLCARLNYNLTQGVSSLREDAGSWTRRMRPDYTVTFWPDGFTLNEAEGQELAVHIHFDAKYRVENITELFGGVDEDLTNEKRQQKRGNYKRADLLKMHAYRDAIRRSEGAYILYPGKSDDPTRFQGFHEILPGLGAFAVKPGPEGEGVGLQQLSRFLDEIIDHVCDRTTAREQHSFHRFDIYRAADKVPATNFGMLPEREDEGTRAVPPLEHPVLVGWCDGPEYFEWYRKTGLYNLRAGSRRGSVRLDPAMAAARHLLLHTKGGNALSGLWKIKVRGPRIFTANELLQKGYPSTPDPNAIYAVFDVEPDSFYLDWKWEYSRLSGRQGARTSAEPFTVSLANVLAVHRS